MVFVAVVVRRLSIMGPGRGPVGRSHLTHLIQQRLIVFSRICLARSGSFTDRGIPLPALPFFVFASSDGSVTVDRAGRRNREASESAGRPPQVHIHRGVSARFAGAIPAGSKPASATEKFGRTGRTQARSVDAGLCVRSKAHRQRPVATPGTTHLEASRPSAANPV